MSNTGKVFFFVQFRLLVDRRLTLHQVITVISYVLLLIDVECFQQNVS